MSGLLPNKSIPLGQGQSSLGQQSILVVGLVTDKNATHKKIILNPKRNTLGNTAISAQRPVYASINTISIMTGTMARSKSEE